jgi:hypothetical protein
MRRRSTTEAFDDHDASTLESLLRITMTIAGMALGGSVCSGLITLALMP